MKYYLLLLLLFLTVGNMSADIAVKSFRKLENDLDARVNYPLKDQNGEICAIIKVVTTQRDFYFDGGMTGIVKTVDKPAEIWVYVPWGLKRITISHPQLGLLRDYFIPVAIEKATVYEMVLITGTLEMIVKPVQTQFVIFTSEPSGADVFVNEQYLGQTPLQIQKPDGNYNYRINKDKFHPVAGAFQFNATEGKKIFDIVLKPNFGFVNVKSIPEDGMNIFINGVQQNGVTPLTSDTLRSGVYEITANKTLFHPQTKSVTIKDNETTTVTFDMKPAFGSIYLESKPEDGAVVFVDGKETGEKTPCLLKKVPSGERVITLRKEFYEPKTIRIHVNEGLEAGETVTLQPNFALVNIKTADDCEMFVDSKLINKGSWKGRLQSGWHTIEVKKAYHHDGVKRVEFQIGEEYDIELYPKPMVGNLKVVSNVIGAIIKLNDKYYGQTPDVINDLLVGEYTLTLGKEDAGSLTKKIIIEENKTLELYEELVTGIGVNIQSNPPGAQLFVNGIRRGSTPLNLTLPFGTQKLKLINGKREIEQTIRVAEDGETNHIFEVSDIMPVNITSYPKGAELYVDGNRIGLTPQKMDIQMGTHQITLMHNKKKHSDEIEVLARENNFHFSTRHFTRSFFKQHPIALSYGYMQTNFNNTIFNNNISTGNIIVDLGHQININSIFYPFIVDVAAFSCGFNMVDFEPFKPNALVSHRGAEISGGIIPFRISSFFFPYILAGYQFSQLYTKDGGLTIEGDAIINTSMPVLKVGVKVVVGQLFIFGELKKTISAGDTNYDALQFGGGLGFMF